MNVEYPPTVRRPGEGRVIGVVGDLCRFLVVGDDTNGRFATWESFVPPGGGPPPHIHGREEESFYVLEGEVTFHVNDECFAAGAGTFVNMPIGSLHWFKNQSTSTAKMLISVTPAGLENMFFEVGQAVEPAATSAPPPSKAEIEQLLAAAPRYGIEIRIPQR